MILVFSGIDCAGKSTQIGLIKKRIMQQGGSVSYLWSRGGYTPGFELIKKTFRLVVGKGLVPSGKGGQRDKMISNLLVRRLWLTIAILDLLVTYVFIVRIKSLAGKVVICDRYLGDTFIDFSLNFPSSNFEKMWLWKLLMAISPKPDAGFLFILPVEESMHRSKLKNEPFPDSKEVLEQRLEIYAASKLFNGQNWLKIDGLDSIDSSASIIKNKVLSVLNHTNAS